MTGAGKTVLFDSPGPKARRRIAAFNTLGALVGLALVAGCLWVLHARGQLEPAKWATLVQWDSWAYYFLPGAWATLKASALAVAGSVVFGLAFGVGRLSHQAWIRIPCAAAVEFLRAVPVLLMMVFVYLYLGYGGFTGIEDKGLVAVVAALIFYNGSVVAELVRSGVHALPRGQREAGAAVGLTRFRSLVHVEVPQALLAMLPALVAQLVVVLKDSALGYMVGYQELLRSSQLLGTTSGQGNSIQTMLMATVLFLAINYALSKLADVLAAKLRGGPRARPRRDLPPTVSIGTELVAVSAVSPGAAPDPAAHTR
ncbi:MAG: amino acid ABC transporter permease [Bifidobacteriaceae bacterium]|nr:amino acid ABC transporter permease [Bifidobacteriaceae bacterium]